MSRLTLTEFSDQMVEILPILMKEFLRRQVEEISKGKVTFPQFLVMDDLNRQGEMKMTDLAASMHVAMATMTGIVERLVRDLYVERLFDPKDRRVIKVRLTAQGCHLAKRVFDARRRMVMSIFAELSEKDRTDYLRILKRVKEVILRDKSERTK